MTHANLKSFQSTNRKNIQKDIALVYSIMKEHDGYILQGGTKNKPTLILEKHESKHIEIHPLLLEILISIGQITNVSANTLKTNIHLYTLLKEKKYLKQEHIRNIASFVTNS